MAKEMFSLSGYSLFGVMSVMTFFVIAALAIAITALYKALNPHARSVEEEDLQDGAVSTRALANDAVTLAKMADNSVGTAELVDRSVTPAKLDKTPILLTDADVTLSVATHGGRTLILPNASSNRTITLPTMATGDSFRFIYGHTGASAADWLINTSATTVLYRGSIQVSDLNAGDNSTSGVNEVFSFFADNSNDDTCRFYVPEVVDVRMIALSSTQIYVSGIVATDTNTTPFS